jgi:hypothetical protein
MRRAELSMGVVMAVFSVYLMYKSAELDIGWIPGEGPGGGAYPFWLAVGMLICSIAIIVRALLRMSPPSRSTEPYMDRHSLMLFVVGAGSLAVTIGLIKIISAYGAILVFLLFYLRFVGRHPWRLTAAIAIVTPVASFFFFEIMLRIILPKGYAEPLFLPLYDIFL